MGLRIKNTNRKIEKEISNILSIEFNKKLKKNNAKIIASVKSLIPQWIYSRPEIASLLADGAPGSLNAQFGFPSGSAAQLVNLMVLSISNSIMVKIIPLDDKLRGGVEFNIQPADYSNLLSSGFSNIVTKEAVIPWLDWILNYGTQTIVFGYSYTPGAYGRSGGGFMKSGGLWRISPEYAGTPGDNVITRAFTGRERELSKLLREIVQ